MCFFIRRDPVAPESVKGLPLFFGDVFDDVLDGSHAVSAVGFPDRKWLSRQKTFLFSRVFTTSDTIILSTSGSLLPSTSGSPLLSARRHARWTIYLDRS